MASGSASIDHHLRSYDWSSEDNAGKWKGLFVSALLKVLKQHNELLTADQEAIEYVEILLVKLLAILTARPFPVTVADIEERVIRTLPSPVDRWALNNAHSALDKGKKKSNIVLPVDKVHALLKEVLQNHRLDEQVSLFLMAILEYISTDILKMAVNYVLNIHHTHITIQDIKVAMCADKLLMDLFHQEDVMPYIEEDGNGLKPVQTYDEVVKELIADEKQYLRDLNMIVKVFRDLIQRHNIASQDELDAIFSNVMDIAELTMTLIGSLEDTLEMTEEGKAPAIGSCFEELAEAEEFEVYDKFSRDILSDRFRKTLDSLLARQEVSDALLSSGHGRRAAVKYYLPVLLLGPVHHCFHYFKYIELLMTLTPSLEERDTLKQVAAMFTPLQNKLQNLVQSPMANKRKPADLLLRMGPNRISRQQHLKRLAQLQQSITNWEGKDITISSSELVYEGKLKVLTDKGKRFAERYVFLCDGIIIVCKQQTKRSSVAVLAQSEYRLREKYLIRWLEVVDRDSDGGGNDFGCTFELSPKDQPRIVFKAESLEEKNAWMAALVMLNTKSMLERNLDMVLGEEEKKHPLRFPPSHLYRFAEPNSDQNIVFAVRTGKDGGVPLIKGATLVKLVERLTYHVYADPMFMKTFLTTYRSFSTPNELLDLLIERFTIPEPEFSSDSESDSEVGEKTSKMRIALDMKRFRKEYSQPVQFRVLNVLKHWVDQHFYDFEQDDELLGKLTLFLDKIAGKSMRKWVDCIINKIAQRKKSSDDNREIVFDFDRSPPVIEFHIENPEEGWPELLTYHPIEIARQMTLLEFQYYRAVKPSELVDQAWTREDKDKRSPNLLRMIRHTTNFTRYLQKLIVETENFEERLAVFQRTLEIMVVFQEYNNFNGVLAITSAMNSSPIFRLTATKERMPNMLLKALEEASSYVQEHCKLYWERLRSINPPCVPFFGQYQTNIMFLEEGNPDFLQGTNLINFSKRRKVAEIISEIQQYQNQPYCLAIYPKLKGFLENLDPFPSMTEKEVTDHLWAKSMEIEPRHPSTEAKKRPEVERKWKGLNLKSPGIKAPKNHPPPIRAPFKHALEETESPTVSPQSFPSTPSNPTPVSPADLDPRKITVMLPSNAQPPPPPLPPKRVVPPVVLRQPSSPPPLPPRGSSNQPPARHQPIKSPLESRSPLMDPVNPRRNSCLDNVATKRSSHQGPSGRSPAPPPLSLRSGGCSDLGSPSPSPSGHRQQHNHSNQTPSPAVGVQRPSPGASTANGPSPVNHFTFSNNHVKESKRQLQQQSPLSHPPPRPPPHKPVDGSQSSSSGQNVFSWDLSASSSSHR